MTRYKGRSNAKAVERDFPHVDLYANIPTHGWRHAIGEPTFVSGMRKSDPHQFDRRNSMVVTMTQKSSSVFLAGLFILGLTAGAQAQGTQQTMPGSPAAVGGQPIRSNPGTGTGVATGSGPLSQPGTPPANIGNRQWGPTQTQPLQQQPFGR